MLSALLLCSSLLVAAPAADRATYEAAKAKVGRDPEAHVKLALWCEAHGLNAERTKHLALAVLGDPQNAVARGLLGMVAFHGQWKRPEVVSEKVSADDALMATMKQYQARRARTPETADAQWKLGLWCEGNGLKAEATAHFSVVTRLDPSREAAWKRLGCKKHNGRWLTEGQIAAEKTESDAQQKADKHWKPLLEKWRAGLAEKGKRRAAVKALEDVTDPRAVPAIWSVFAKTGVAHQEVAVQLFGQIDAPSASRDLALLAVLSPSVDVRRKAAETLRMRDARDYGGVLVSLLRDPIKYEVRPVNGPGSQGVLFIQGKKAKVKRLYSPPSAPNITPQPGDQFGVDANGLPVVAQLFVSTVSVPYSAPSPLYTQSVGLQITEMLERGGYGSTVSQNLGHAVSTNLQNPVIISSANIPIGGHKGGVGRPEAFLYGQTEIPIGEMIAEAQLAAVVAQRQLATDVATIERNNAPIIELNGRTRKILCVIAGSDLGEDRETWQKWYIDLLGFAFTPQMATQETPTFVEQVPLAYQPQAQPINIVEGSDPVFNPPHHSCFGRGTLVKTINGPRAIESIQRGDLVLTQDAQTGVLSFQPVLTSIHNPPNDTLRISLGDEPIVVTGIHRFWKAGGGWVMARNLKLGDILRTVGGTAEVAGIESDKVQPVFNLEVAQGQSFFVGNQGALVHDNGLVNAVPEPFDALPDLATIASAPR